MATSLSGSEINFFMLVPTGDWTKMGVTKHRNGTEWTRMERNEPEWTGMRLEWTGMRPEWTSMRPELDLFYKTH